MATDKAMGFMKDPARLLVAIARGENCLVIIANWIGLKDSDRRAMKRPGLIRSALERDSAYKTMNL
jgi:hypothetical protein